jgi:hypothetical protein
MGRRFACVSSTTNREEYSHPPQRRTHPRGGWSKDGFCAKRAQSCDVCDMTWLWRSDPVDGCVSVGTRIWPNLLQSRNIIRSGGQKLELTRTIFAWPFIRNDSWQGCDVRYRVHSHTTLSRAYIVAESLLGPSGYRHPRFGGRVEALVTGITRVCAANHACRRVEEVLKGQ